MSNLQCGCKGIRYCLLCERTKLELRKSSHLSAKKIFTYCSKCTKAWTGSQSCPNHNGDCMEFPGIRIHKDFVSLEEEAILVSNIEKTPWVLSQSGRNKQDYGPKVNFKKKKVKCGVFSGLPPYSEFLVKKIQEISSLKDFIPVELCNLEYTPERGSAIDAHFDDFWLWGERLVTLTLLSDTAHTMTHDNLSDVEVIIPLPARSLVVCAGPARYEWKHGIKRDDISKKRIAMTFRELSEEFCSGGKSENIGKEVIETAMSFGGSAVGLIDGMVEKQKMLQQNHDDDRSNCNSESSTEFHEGKTANNDGFQIVSKRKAARRVKVKKNEIICQDDIEETLCANDARKWQEDVRSYCHEVKQKINIDYQCITCYGLGSFSKNKAAGHQLGLLLSLTDSNVQCSIYDPVFTNQEKKLLTDLGITVLDKNEEGKCSVKTKVLFYMPHCGRPLYNNLLWANWLPHKLSCVCILGNSFSHMQQTTPSRIFQKESYYIHQILPYTNEVPIPNTFAVSDVFNNLSVHTFKNVDNLPSDFWENPPEPFYDDDPEIILASCQKF